MELRLQISEYSFWIVKIEINYYLRTHFMGEMNMLTVGNNYFRLLAVKPPKASSGNTKFSTFSVSEIFISKNKTPPRI